MEKIKLILIILFALFAGCTGEKTMITLNDNTVDSILYDKPVFTLSVHTFGTRYDVLLNGVMVYDDDSGGGQITTSVPVNHWMKAGQNSLELIVYPDDEGIPVSKNSFINIELLVGNDGTDKQFNIGGFEFTGKSYIDETKMKGYQLSVNSFQLDESGTLIVSDVVREDDTYFDGVVEFSKHLNIPSNLPLWAFFTSEDVIDANSLSDDEFWGLSDKIGSKLDYIRENLVAGNVDLILPLFKERNIELDQAFYYSKGTMEAKLRDSFEVDISQLDMLNIQHKHVAYENEINMKLASVYRKGRGAAISGNFKEGPGSLKFPIMFRKQDDKWLITR